MKLSKQLALCLFSALTGAFLFWLVETIPWVSSLPAQEAPKASGQRFQPGPTRGGGPANPNIPPGWEDLTPEERVNVSVYERVNRSVVNINTKTVRNDSFFLLEAPSEGTGSGSVLDTAGHVLTNFHVIEGAREIEVTLYNTESFPAEVVGIDPSSDVAVLKVNAPPELLHPVEMGDSSLLRVGQKVYAIGNPFGLERTLTTGIVSSLNRSLPSRTGRTIHSIIQIDAAMNPGNSGGPLLDTRGRLIGMNTAIASRTGQSAGVGFAIPANTFVRIVPQLIEKGRVIRPEIGIARVYETERGLLVAALVPNGPAERAGLRGPKIIRERKGQGNFFIERQTVDRSAADLIVAADGKKVLTGDELLGAIDTKKPGEEVLLTIIREGREINLPVLLGESDM